jgi:enterochelin esterase-like enzyme
MPTASATAVPPTPTPACTETRGRVETGTFFSAIIGQEQPYRVYLPPCYDFHDGRYPVLYMLHGYPFDDSHWDEIGIDEAADAGIASGTLPPFVIAMPGADNEGSYTNTSGGPGSFEAVLLDEFMPFIEAAYRVADVAEGRAIGGMSRGGVWSLEIAFRNPDQFAAVGGHSVALNVNRAPPVYDPLYLAADPAIRSLRIYLDVGQGDWTLPGMEELHAALTAADVAHDYYVYEGYHDDSYWSENVAEYLAFYTADW